LTADATSKAACLRARGTEAARVDSDDAPPSDVAGMGAESGGALVGVAFEEKDEGPVVVLAGVVVMEVAVVATGPMTSLSSPNSFHSSTSWSWEGEKRAC
jgi:hypothetical protein